ncbi:MAG: hypothetical protein RR626_02165 [Anaerovoracaceae bacterium]
MKRIIIGALAVIMMLAMVGCGGEEKESLTVATFKDITAESGYHMNLEMTAEGQAMTMDMQVKGDQLYVDGKLSGETVLMIKNAEGFYVLMPSLKQGIKVTLDAKMEKDLEGIKEVTDMGVQAKDAEYTEGEMDIDGTTYQYEEFKDDDKNVAKFCYKDGKLAYLISTADGVETKIKINSLDNKVDEALFKVPTDYTITEGTL